MADQRERAGLQAAIAAFTTWGLLTVYWKQLGEFDPVELIAWRVASAALIMSVAVTVLRRWAPVLGAFRDAPTRLRLGAAGVLLTVNWMAYVWAVTNDRVLETALGYFLSPLGTMAIGVFVLGEQLTPFRWASIGFAATGVVVLTVSYGRVPWIALVIAGSWSTYGLIKRRVPLAPAESLTAEMLVLLGPALLTIVVASSGAGWPGAEAVWAQADGIDWLLVIGTGAITAFPLTLFAFAAQRVPFTLLGPANYLVPLINFLLGWVVYDESLPWVRAVGFGLVWFALGLVTVEMVRAHRRTVRLRREPATVA
ncbi:MAG: EamA family transporter RarD [Ilumatobacter fluminis]|uniref:EamA family transporter RarD n=1 Tax=Ilumatobacter fluminis TaxID=467091 RepID=UPI0032EB948E